MKLARIGYGGGEPEKVLKMPVGIVVAMLQYEKFLDNYERAYVALNKKEGGA